ncbi:MAG: hypothetical protein ACI9TH_000454 [Kiritimatiellia bacterium]|jgi:hypothetical protein
MKYFLHILPILLITTLQSWAVPVTITDTTLTGATLDGLVNVGEYAGENHGVNTGFGDVGGAGAFCTGILISQAPCKSD